MLSRKFAVAAMFAIGLSTPLYAPAVLAQDAPTGNAMDGQDAFSDKCAICHDDTQGGVSGAGPNLYGVVGRKAGVLEGFAFTDAMKNSGITWDAGTIYKYIQDPGGLVPGTKMSQSFMGVKDPQMAADIVAYLHTLNGAAPAGGAAAPAAAPAPGAATPPAGGTAPATTAPPAAPATPAPTQ